MRILFALLTIFGLLLTEARCQPSHSGLNQSAPSPASFCQGLSRIIDCAQSRFASFQKANPEIVNNDDGTLAGKSFKTKYSLEGFSECAIYFNYDRTGPLRHESFYCFSDADSTKEVVSSTVAACLGNDWTRTGSGRTADNYQRSGDDAVTVVALRSPVYGRPNRMSVSVERKEQNEQLSELDQKRDVEDAKQQAAEAAQLDQQESLENTLDLLQGKWACKEDYSVASSPGRNDVNGNPVAGSVLVTTSREYHFEILSLDATEKTAIGSLVILENRHIATQWEFDGYNQPDKPSASEYIPPVCFDAQHNQCIRSSANKIEYDISGLASLTQTQLVLKASRPSCKGMCPDHLTTSKTLELAKRKGEDFFSYEGVKCLKVR
jgi:hypothetical protein